MGSKSLFTVSVNVKSYGLVEVMGLQGYGLRECRLYSTAHETHCHNFCITGFKTNSRVNPNRRNDPVASLSKSINFLVPVY